MTYKEAAADAQRRADETGRDHGISKDAFGGFGVFALPAKPFRFGRDLACEVRSCTSFDRMLPGHGCK